MGNEEVSSIWCRQLHARLHRLQRLRLCIKTEGDAQVLLMAHHTGDDGFILASHFTLMGKPAAERMEIDLEPADVCRSAGRLPRSKDFKPGPYEQTEDDALHPTTIERGEHNDDQ